MNDKISGTSPLSPRKSVDVVEVLVLLIIIIRFCYPVQAGLGSIGGYAIYYFIYLFFLLLVFLKTNNFFVTFIKSLWIPLLFIVLIFIRAIYGKNTGFGFFDPLRLTISMTNMVVAYSLYLYIRERSIYFQKRVVITAVASMSISILYALYYIMFIDYLAVRNATKIHQGVGDFSLVYGAIFLSIVVLLNLIKNKKQSRLSTLVLSINYIMILGFILKANFMTAVVLFIITTILTILPFKKATFFLISVSGIVLYFMRSSIGRIILQTSNGDLFSWVIQEKMNVIGNFLVGYSKDLDTFGIRLDKISYTLNTFLSNPLLGVNYSNYNALTIGGHTQWFDDLARYGVIGVILWWGFHYCLYKETIDYTQDQLNRKAIKTGWLLFIIFGFLNPNTNSTVTMLLFTVLPFTNALLKEKKRKGARYGKVEKTQSIYSDVSL